MGILEWLFGSSDERGDVDDEPHYTAADIEAAAISDLRAYGPQSARHLRITGPGTHITTGEVLADMEACGIVRTNDDGDYYLVEE